MKRCLHLASLLLYFLGVCNLFSACAPTRPAMELAAMQRLDLTRLRDDRRVLENPHKGWYHHYFDNGLDRYLVSSEAELDTFPALDHLYLRLAWAYLEPEPEQYNWALIDTVIEKWTARGYKIAFRITAKETGVKFATPEWVKEAGAKGRFVQAYGQESWQPDFGDPIFLQYLDRFHHAFAVRYAGKPWLAYVDVGSYGEWGEGHNSASGGARWPFEALKQHIDCYLKHYPDDQIVISDDFVHEGVVSEDRPEMERYVLENGLTYRDDSILVGWYVRHYAETFTVRSPELFEQVWRERPVVMELQHYSMMKDPKRDSSWVGQDGSISGAAMLRKAVELEHPTWIGYHGYASEWLRDNPNLTRELANRVGYWFFLDNAVFPRRTPAGSTVPIELVWTNRGVAPAYHPYALKVRLCSGEWSTIIAVAESGNTRWMPGARTVERYTLALPNDLPSGECEVAVALVDEGERPARPIRLALDRSIEDPDGFYRIGTIEIMKPVR